MLTKIRECAYGATDAKCTLLIIQFYIFSGRSLSKESACNAGDLGLPTPVFLPGEFHGQRSLAGYSPWGRKESDTTEVAEHASMRGTYRLETILSVF